MTLLLVAALSLRLPYLVAADEGGRPLLYLRLWPENRFTLTYMHSVQKTPCSEEFRPGHDGGLVLTATEYQSLGVGLPFLPGEGKLTIENGRFVIRGLSRRFAEIGLRAMPVARQALVVQGRRYELTALVPPGSLIRLQVVRKAPLMVLWEKLRKGEE